MLNNLSRLFFLAALMSYTIEGLCINPDYDYFNGNKRCHTTVCVPIQSYGAGSDEPDFMCKDPHFSLRQTPQNFAIPNAENYGYFKQQQVNEENNQLIYTPQALRFGNNYQQNVQFTQKHENIGGGMQIPITPVVRQNHVQPVTAYRYYQQNTDPSMPFHSEYSVENPSLSSTNHRDSDDNKSQPSSVSSKTDISSDTIGNQEQKPNTFNFNGQDLYTNTVKHNIDPKQYRTLLEDEILSTPDLRFSHDEMLSIQHLYSGAKIPLTPQISQIPPEYYNDPVLRTFYNIDHYHYAEPVQKPYLPPIMSAINPPLHEQLLSAKSSSVCSNLYWRPFLGGYLPPTELAKNYFDCPFTFQPIFLVVPFLNVPYQDLASNMRAFVCGHGQDATNVPIEINSNKGSYRSQSGDEQKNTFDKDLLAKKSPDIPEDEIKTADSQIEKKLTENSDSSEDLFAEETTISADKAVSEMGNEKSNDGITNTKEETSTSLSRPEQTTVKSFKSLLNAAKTHAVRYHESNDSSVNKRHTSYGNNGVYPSYWKKQYVKKLETDKDHSSLKELV